MLAAGMHPCIVRYFSSWVEADSRGGYHFYILMERCLESLDTKRKLRGGPFSEGELIDLLRQVIYVIKPPIYYTRSTLHCEAVSMLKLMFSGFFLCKVWRADTMLLFSGNALLAGGLVKEAKQVPATEDWERKHCWDGNGDGTATFRLCVLLGL